MSLLPAFWKDLEFFKPEEFACNCCGENEMKHSFMLNLDLLRGMYGAPLVVSSGYRCPAHNTAVSSTGASGPHTTGEAADIPVFGAAALKLLMLTHKVGFTGVGISQASKTEHKKRFIHLDTLGATPTRPRPHLWSY